MFFLGHDFYSHEPFSTLSLSSCTDIASEHRLHLRVKFLYQPHPHFVFEYNARQIFTVTEGVGRLFQDIEVVRCAEMNILSACGWVGRL